MFLATVEQVVLAHAFAFRHVQSAVRAADHLLGHSTAALPKGPPRAVLHAESRDCAAQPPDDEHDEDEDEDVAHGKRVREGFLRAEFSTARNPLPGFANG